MKGDPPEIHNAKVNGLVHLFMYVKEVAKEIGEDKALELLSKTQVDINKKWFEENKSKLDLSGPPLLAAYRVGYETRLGRNLADIKIVEQSEDRIVHHYDIPCTILDACQKVGLDTRKICKALHKEAEQAFMQLIDPRIRFDRDYNRIRPYTDYCVEMYWLEK